MPEDPKQRGADVVLRSSDGQTFYSWKTVLSLSSPVFSDMFSLPLESGSSNNADKRNDDLPVVDMAEDGQTLALILVLCQPPSCTGTQFGVTSQELGTVLEVTAKYDMGQLHHMALMELTNPLFLREDPLKIYVLASQHACPDAARLAAKHTLALPTMVREYIPELEKIHAGKLCRLLLYREACVAAVQSLADDHTWIVHGNFSSLFGCEDDENTEWTKIRNPPSRKYRTGRIESVPVHRWWKEYMRKAGSSLQRSPCGGTVKRKELVDDVFSAISSSKCEQCDGFEVWKTFQSFVDAFAENIEGRIAEVEINLGD